MLVSRLVSHASRKFGQRANLLFLLSSPSQKQLHPLLHQHLNEEFIPSQVSLFHHSAISSFPFGRHGFTSLAWPEPSEKERETTAESSGTSSNAEQGNANGDAKPFDRSVDFTPTKDGGSSSESQPTSQSAKRRRYIKRTTFSDSDSEVGDDLPKDDLVKLLAEKDELLKSKSKEIEQMQDKVLRTYAEMENVMERTKREAENSKKFAIQNFAKSLLDVADNLGRASLVVKDSFSKMDTSNDATGVLPLLKTLLEGVEMTEKQLVEVFKKFGVEKFDPINESFDPHRHNAVFQVPDPAKEPGTVAHVLKAGYMLHDRVIRPAEVGVTQAVEDDAEEVKD